MSISAGLILKNEKNRRNNVPEKLSINCLQCDKNFKFPNSKDDYLGHLFLDHRLVIADVDDIASLEEYLMFWEKNFKKGHALNEFCTTMLLDKLPNGVPSKNERYYLLSDFLPMDYDIRRTLQIKKLNDVLQQYQYEKTDRKFSRECLYCRDVINGLRAEYIEHLFKKHFLQLGKPENLVYVDELINCVENKLKNLICIFCEKIFKDRGTLKEHMRKKGHKRINPDIKFYDKFYLENYRIDKLKYSRNMFENKDNETKCNKKKFHRQKIDNKFFSANSDDDSDSDWSDWDGEKMPFICLLCSTKDKDFNKLKEHMISDHNFDFDKITQSLNFYQKVKVVNFIRRQVMIKQCIECNEQFTANEELCKHIKNMKHFDLNKKRWDSPEYFFPTFDDDSILCQLDNESDDLNAIGENENYLNAFPTVISEEIQAEINKDAEALSMENFFI